MRFTASHPPLMGPYFRMASVAYAEQVGTYLHDGGVKGEMQQR